MTDSNEATAWNGVMGGGGQTQCHTKSDLAVAASVGAAGAAVGVGLGSILGDRLIKIVDRIRK